MKFFENLKAIMNRIKPNKWIYLSEEKADSSSAPIVFTYLNTSTKLISYKPKTKGRCASIWKNNPSLHREVVLLPLHI